MSSRPRGVVFEIDPAHLEHPVLAFLKDYWERKRGSRPFPARADIMPAQMKEHLGWIVLVDVLSDEFRYRMIGSRVSAYFLKQATGKTVSEAFAEYGQPAVDGVRALHRRTAREKVVIRASGGADWLGKPAFDFDALCLPLSDDGASVNMILCGFTFGLADTLKAKSGA
jgi:hypothetical protein